MGLRGPKPEPAVVKAWKGNPGRRPLNLSDGVNPPLVIPTKPRNLSKFAAAEWDRASEELIDLGLMAEIDLASFETYCRTKGEVDELEGMFEEAKRESRRSYEAENKKLALMDAYFYKTPTGFLRESQLHRTLVEMRAELDRYVRNFGMNPSARMRVSPSNAVQPSLPGFDSEASAPQPAAGFARFAVVEGGGAG